MILLPITRHTGICSLPRTTLLASMLFLCFTGCAAVRSVPELHPPIMEQGELVRPYSKIAVIECSNQRFGNAEWVTQADYDWAHKELRERAHRLGADAVMLPEVRIERDSFLMFPFSNIHAKGVAIRFNSR